MAISERDHQALSALDAIYRAAPPAGGWVDTLFARQQIRVATNRGDWLAFFHLRRLRRAGLVERRLGRAPLGPQVRISDAGRRALQ
jgi:hypothetical protein